MGPRKRKDETSELTLGELDVIPLGEEDEEPPTEELETLEELDGDELDEVVSDGAVSGGAVSGGAVSGGAVSGGAGTDGPPPPPKPGLGRPRKPKVPVDHVQTLPSSVAPSSAPATGRSPAPRPSAEVPPPPPPTDGSAPKKSVPPPPRRTEAPPRAATPSAAPARPRSAPPPPPKPETPKKAAKTAAAKTAGAKSEAAKSVAAPRSARKKPRPQPEAAPVVAPTEVAVVDASAEALRDLCLAQLDQKPDPERKARLFYELGRLYELELADLTKAAEHYQDAIRITADHAAAIRGARRTLAALGRHPALPALFDAEVAITRDPPARAQLLYAKARVMEEHLRQSAQALAVYREALRLDPGNLAILKAIERGLRRDKAWQPLADIYGELANAVSDAPLRAAWTAARAHITETHLADPVQAAALYEAALEAEPHTTTALANVKRLGAAHQRWPQLVAALRREHELASDARARSDILSTIARIQEQRLGDTESAVQTLEDAISESPKDGALLAELARLHRATGRHAKEVEALSLLVERTDDAATRATLANRIGHLYEQRLDDIDRARPWYERCLADDPTHRDAAIALARIHEKRRRWADVIAVLDAQAAASKSAAARAALHHRIGAIFERELERPDEAAGHHQKALTLEPAHRGAFAALARLHAAAQRWAELAELYERSIDRAAHDGEAISWLFRLAGVLEDRLDDPVGALAAYRRILERDPAHLGALSAGQRAAERAGQHAELVALLEAEAKLEKDPARVSDLLHRAAVATSEGLEDPAAAIRMLERVLTKAPAHRSSLETLAGLLNEGGKWLELVGAYRRLLPLTSTEEEKVRLYHRMGEIQETQLGQLREALQSYELALRLDRDFAPARDALRAALERAESWPELAKLLESRLGALSGIAKARAATELGMLYEERLKDPIRALGAYEAALEGIPLFRPALDARERLLTQKSDWGRLQEVLAEEAEASEDPFLKTQAALRAAFVRSEQQGAVAPALDAFRPVFAEHPDHVGALLAVEEIYTRTRDDAGLAVTYEKMASVLSDPKAKLAALQELARTRAASDGEPTGIHRRVLVLSPDDPVALEALAADAAARGEGKTELAMQARLASTASDPTVGAYHQCRVGEILLAEEDAGSALAAFRAALGLDPRSLSATRGLTRAARLARDPAALRQAARHEAEIAQDLGVAVGLCLEAAVLRQDAEELAEAATDYGRALALDPDHADAAAGLHATLVRAGDVARLAELLTRAAHAAKRAERKAALHLHVAQLHADVGDDLGAAVAAAERALSVRADDPPALSALAAYLERNAQWQRAVDTLERLIPKARDEALVDAHLRLARMADEHLGDRGRAVRSLRAVLSRDEEREEALAALVRLERLEGRDEEALRLCHRLIEVVKDEEGRADALAELAELELARGDGAAAASAALGAVQVVGPDSGAASVYKRLIASAPQQASWDAYASGLTAYLTRAKERREPVAPTYRELAKVFGEANNRPDRAIATLREAVEACPADPSISLALADALRTLRANDKALAEIRRLLSVDITAAPGWRAMADLLRAMAEPDGAAVALAPLVALGLATEEETRIVKTRVPRVADAPSGILGEGGLKQLVDEGSLDASATSLLHALTDVFAKLEGFDPDEWGVSKRDRLRAGDPHAVRAFADRIGHIYGVTEFDLYMVDAHGLDRAVMMPGSPATLLVSKKIEDASDAVLAFHLARPLALFSRFLHAIDVLPDAEVTRMLVAAAQHFEHAVDTSRIDPAELEEERRRVGSAIGFFSRGRMKDAAAHFAAAPTPDLERWAQNLRRMATRAALLICDDLLAALEAHGPPLGEDPFANDLACFWAADPAMRFRRAVAQHV